MLDLCSNGASSSTRVHTVAWDLELGPGSQGCAFLLGDSNGLENAITIALEVQRDTGQGSDSHRHELHGYRNCRVTGPISAPMSVGVSDIAIDEVARAMCNLD
jgi:hypothetical protein